MTNSKYTVLLDNGHGKNVIGKCSPDKTLLEYLWTREICKLLQEALKVEGINSLIIVPEEWDVSLTERVRRVNNIYAKDKNIFLVSIHVNAAGADGKWHNASGFSSWVAPNASLNSKKLARIFCENAIKDGLKGNRAIPAEKYWVGNFTIIKRTNCPAVLTENMFQDNKEDVKFLLSPEGKKKIVDLHVKSIKEYIK